MARTGQRLIDGMTSDEALFKYLMDNAIAYKDALTCASAWPSAPNRWPR